MKYYRTVLLINLLFYCFSSYGQLEANNFTNLTPEAFRTAISSEKNIVLLDVRTPEEYAQGHLAGAININFFAPDFKEQVKKLLSEKSIFVYCAVGGRSTKAASILTDMALEMQIYNLTGGFTAWQKAKYPVETK